MKRNYEKRKESCPECGSSKIIEDKERGEIICGNCGCVIREKMIDESPEWRAFSYEEVKKRKRVGPPYNPLVHDGDLSTAVCVYVDTRGRSLSPEVRRKARRLDKLQKRLRVSNSKERSLMRGLSCLRDFSHLPRHVIVTARKIYERALEMGFIRGRKLEGVAIASLLVAIRMCGLPVSVEEIAEEAEKREWCEKLKIFRYYRDLEKIGIYTSSFFNVAEFRKAYLSTLCNRLELTPEANELAMKILRIVEGTGIHEGRNPRGISAAIVYLSSLLTSSRISQETIKKEARVTEVTLRNRYTELLRVFRADRIKLRRGNKEEIGRVREMIEDLYREA